MKKVVIITLNGYFNYGNRLQNYALQETIKNLNFEVITEKICICNKNIKIEKISLLKKMRIIKLNEFASKVLNKMWFILNAKKIKITKQARLNSFKKFTHDKINESKYTIVKKENIIIKNTDYFITGSDQVWNPEYNFVSDIYFLAFAPNEKRIAYAPSFGISEIPEEYKENYKKWLSEINYLSVREESGAKIIKELTGRDVPVLVDPTLLLTREKWLTIAKPAKNKPKSNYLVTYFLGGISTKEKKEINKFAKENKLKIISLGDIKEKDIYVTDPSEFIDYINSCDIMFTDSFHGAVFSILFEKPFVVYERVGNVSMYSRIETLLNMFKLENRAYKKLKLDSSIFNINYSHVPKILESERKKSFNYLKEALDIKEK